MSKQALPVKVGDRLIDRKRNLGMDVVEVTPIVVDGLGVVARSIEVEYDFNGKLAADIIHEGQDGPDGEPVVLIGNPGDESCQYWLFPPAQPFVDVEPSSSN